MPERFGGVSILLILACILLPAAPAAAHKVNLWASVGEGGKIEGSVYFPGGGKARGLTVEVYGPGGEKLGSTVTDDEGSFIFEPRSRVDHRFVAETVDGHRAEYTVPAAELPESLPAPGGARKPEKAAPGEGRAPEKPAAAGPVPAGSDLEALVERAVRKEVEPLREQLRDYEDRTRLHDILGGIGYILGLAGIFFFFKGRKASK